MTNSFCIFTAIKIQSVVLSSPDSTPNQTNKRNSNLNKSNTISYSDKSNNNYGTNAFNLSVNINHSNVIGLANDIRPSLVSDSASDFVDSDLDNPRKLEPDKLHQETEFEIEHQKDSLVLSHSVLELPDGQGIGKIKNEPTGKSGTDKQVYPDPCPNFESYLFNILVPQMSSQKVENEIISKVDDDDVTVVAALESGQGSEALDISGNQHFILVQGHLPADDHFSSQSESLDDQIEEIILVKDTKFDTKSNLTEHARPELKRPEHAGPELKRPDLKFLQLKTESDDFEEVIEVESLNQAKEENIFDYFEMSRKKENKVEVDILDKSEQEICEMQIVNNCDEAKEACNVIFDRAEIKIQIRCKKESAETKIFDRSDQKEDILERDNLESLNQNEEFVTTKGNNNVNNGSQVGKGVVDHNFEKSRGQETEMISFPVNQDPQDDHSPVTTGEILCHHC